MNLNRVLHENVQRHKQEWKKYEIALYLETGRDRRMELLLLCLSEAVLCRTQIQS